MARKAKSIVTREIHNWRCELADNTEVSVWTNVDKDSGGLYRTSVSVYYHGVESGWRLNHWKFTDETVIGLVRSLIAGKDTAAILADRLDELEKDTFGHYTTQAAEKLRLANTLMVKEAKKRATAAKAKRNRELAKHAMESLGMKKVRGAMGGTFWE